MHFHQPNHVPFSAIHIYRRIGIITNSYFSRITETADWFTSLPVSVPNQVSCSGYFAPSCEGGAVQPKGALIERNGGSFLSDGGKIKWIIEQRLTIDL